MGFHESSSQLSSQELEPTEANMFAGSEGGASARDKLVNLEFLV